MMMSALKAGGMPLVVDEIRQADANNPKGYNEFERVKKLPKGDTVWLATASGKAVKIISALLEFLPQDYAYRIIFMERDLGEILASQQRMMIRNGKELGLADEENQLYQSFIDHLSTVNQWLAGRKGVQTLYVSYNDICRIRWPISEGCRISGGQSRSSRYGQSRGPNALSREIRLALWLERSYVTANQK